MDCHVKQNRLPVRASPPARCQSHFLSPSDLHWPHTTTLQPTVLHSLKCHASHDSGALACLPVAVYNDTDGGDPTPACACGWVARFDIGFVSIGGTDWLATLGFTCSTGEARSDPAAAGLALSKIETTVAVGGRVGMQFWAAPGTVWQRGCWAARHSYPHAVGQWDLRRL